jgi:YidC/Oxa1 family membrane protein insertase
MITSLIFAIPIISTLERFARDALNWLHVTFHLPWAWAIVVLTVIVRMLLVPLTVKQIHSMQNLQRFAPQMKEIQKKYKGDKQKQNEELMKFYRENNINPAASCLPMLAQLPVFISLYYALKQFAKHPPAGSMSWLHFVPNITWHTTSFWGGYVLLVVYVASQMASTLFMSATADKTQRYLFMIMPLVFVFVIARFPAGLVLYWVTTNLWTVGQGLITRRLMPRPAAPEKRSSRSAPKEEPTDETDGGSSGNGAAPKPSDPKPQPSARAAPPRRVRRKKGAGRR